MDALTNAVTDSCEPMIIPNIMVREIDEKQIIIMEIMPGMERPYFIKSKGMINGTYIRTAGTTRPADQVILQELILEAVINFLIRNLFGMEWLPTMKLMHYAGSCMRLR